MNDLLDALPLAVVVIDDGRIVEWNEAAEVLYGHDRTSVLGSDFVELLFEPSDRARASEIVAAAHVAGWDGNFRVARRDGVLLVSGFRLAPLGGSRAAWLAVDQFDHALAQEERAILLSAEHAARATAEEALALLEAVLAAAPVGIAVLDPSLCFSRVNGALAAITGVAVADHAGRSFDEIMSMPPEVIADLRRVLTTGRTILGREVSGTMPSRPGVDRHFVVNSYPVLDGGGATAGVGITVIEITDRKRAEAERIELLARAEAAQHRLAVLATASSVLTSTMDVGSMLERLARVLTPAVADLCIIELIDGVGALEELAVSHQDAMLADEIRSVILKQPSELTRRGPIADVVASGRARLYEGGALDDALTATSRHPRQREVNHSLGLSAAILAPIEARGVVLGVLGLSVTGDRGSRTTTSTWRSSWLTGPPWRSAMPGPTSRNGARRRRCSGRCCPAPFPTSKGSISRRATWLQPTASTWAATGTTSSRSRPGVSGLSSATWSATTSGPRRPWGRSETRCVHSSSTAASIRPRRWPGRTA